MPEPPDPKRVVFATRPWMGVPLDRLYSFLPICDGRDTLYFSSKSCCRGVANTLGNDCASGSVGLALL
jgi:hypothetical protein